MNRKATLVGVAMAACGLPILIFAFFGGQPFGPGGVLESALGGALFLGGLRVAYLGLRLGKKPQE